MDDRTLTVSEVFRSIQGESTHAGLPCAFVRTMGCNLRCRWCDTEYARDGEGVRMGVGQILQEVEGFGTRLVCITGGEPLMQAGGVEALAARLLEGGHTVLLETNGSMDLSSVPDGVVRVMDVKCPGSGECGTTLETNVKGLRPCDEAKFVIAGRADFEWAAAFVRDHGLTDGPHVLFAPAHGLVAPVGLAGWILEEGIEVRLQLQLHKVLWPGRARGV